MKERIISYWNAGAEGYSHGIQRLIRSPDNNKGWKGLFSEYLHNEPQKILDVGTGPGSISILLAGMGHSVTAVDLSDQMLTCARENAESCGVHIDFRKGDAEKLPFEDNTFDTVVNRWVLWTVPDPNAALGEWYRVLRPGGRLLIFDGNWYNGRKTLLQKAWMQCSHLYSLLQDHRNMWKRESESDFVQDLWSTSADRPRDDLLLFQKAGFQELQASMGVNKRVMTWGDYLRQGYWGDTFLVTGTKPAGR